MRLTAALVLTFGLAGTCLAQERYVKPRGGEFLCYVDHVGALKDYAAPAADGAQYGLTLAQSRAFEAQLTGIAADLKRLPVFNPLQGVRVQMSTDFCCASQCQRWGTCKTLPPYGRIWVLLPYYYTSFKPGTPFTDIENRSELEILFNNPGPLAGASVQKLKSGRDAIYQPMPFRRIGPVQLYRNGDVYAFLTRGDRPLWLPVSRADFLEARIAERESQFGEAMKLVTDARMLADTRKAVEELVGPLRAQLRSLSPAERSAQAWVSNPELGLAAPGSPEARPLVTLNPDFFDRTRPRTKVQLVILRFEGLDLETFPSPSGARPLDVAALPLRYCSDVAGYRLWELANQLNWSALQALVD